MFRFRPPSRFGLRSVGGAPSHFGPLGPRVAFGVWGPRSGPLPPSRTVAPCGPRPRVSPGACRGWFRPCQGRPSGPLGPWPFGPPSTSPCSGSGLASSCHSLPVRRGHTLLDYSASPRRDAGRAARLSTSIAPVMGGLRKAQAADLVRTPRPRPRSRRAAANWAAVLGGLREAPAADPFRCRGRDAIRAARLQTSVAPSLGLWKAPARTWSAPCCEVFAAPPGT